MLDGVVKQSIYRQYYHITPPQGLLNDPNGLIYFKGNYHVFYQWNPTGTTHINKVWGHVISEDLVHWRRVTPAIVPSESYDKDGIYSGTAIEKDGVLYLFYTGNVVNSDGTKASYQCYATSTDGINFEKKGVLFDHPKGYTRHVRDPKVWFEQETNQWYLILGAQTDEKLGTVIYYSSENLIDWDFHGELFSENELDKLKQRGFMWECPDIVREEGHCVFIYSPQGLEPEENRYLNIYQSAYFIVEKEEERHIISDSDIVEIDSGFEFYAPQTFRDKAGNLLLLAWMGVMTPEVEQSQPTIKEGWVHHLTIPRLVKFKENRLIQTPAPQLEALRNDKKTLFLENNWLVSCEKMAFELVFSFEKNLDDFNLVIKDTTFIKFVKEKNKISINRKNWFTEQLEQRSIVLEEPLTDMQLFVDGSSIELFVNQGQHTASLRYFDNGESKIAYSGKNLGYVDVYRLT